MKIYTVQIKVTAPNDIKPGRVQEAILTMLSIGMADAQDTVNDPPHEPHNTAKAAVRLRIADPVIVRVESPPLKR